MIVLTVIFAIVLIIAAFAALMKFPRVGTVVAFTLIVSIVDGGKFFSALPFLLVSSVVLTLALQLSPRMGIMRSAKSHKTYGEKTARYVIILSEAVLVVGLVVMTLLSIFLRRHCGAIGHLLTRVLKPIAGLIVVFMINTIVEGTWGSDEEIEEGLRQQKLEAERKKQEEERQRIAAEKAANSKRLKNEADQIKVIWEKALAEYGDVGGFISYASDPDSPAGKVYLSSMGIQYNESPKVYMYGKRTPSIDLTPLKEPSQIWVTNDKRIHAIDTIILNTGLFDVGQFQQSATEAPYLMELIARMNNESETPLFGCQLPQIHIVDGGDKSNPWATYVEKFINHEYKAECSDYFTSCFCNIIKFYEAEYFGIKAGIDGENYVRRVLDMHDGEFFALYDVRLEFPGDDGKNESVETDVLVLSPNGLFALEIKNYGSSGSYKIVVTQDGQWYKEFKGAKGKRESIPNPVAQNDRHIAFLGKFINDLLGRNMMNRVEIENVIVLANDNVETDISPKAALTVTRPGNVYNCIAANKTQRFSMEELTKIKTEIEKRMLPPQAFPLEDYSEELKDLVKNYRIIVHGATIMNRARQEHPDWFANL